MPGSRVQNALSEVPLGEIPKTARFAAALRGFGPVGILAILVILAAAFLSIPLSALLVLAWRWLSRTRWADLGYVRPESWIKTIAIGIVFGVALKFFMKAIAMPLIGAPPINQAFHFLAGNTAALPWMFLIDFGAGFGEETLFRSWMFERLRKLFGPTVFAKVLIVLVTSALFAAAHYAFQGLPGVQQAMVVGLIVGTIFAVTGRIFMLMIAHVAFDLTATAMIYWDVETAVAHAIFS